MHVQAHKQDKAVLIIDLAKRAPYRCVLNEETSGPCREIRDVLRLIMEAKKLGIPVFTFMEYHRPPLKHIRNTVNGYGPIFEKTHPSALGELRGRSILLRDQLPPRAELYIAGYDLSICVGATIQSATAYGYNVRTAPSLLYMHVLTPRDAAKEMLEYYRAEGMLEPDFSSLLVRLKQ